MSEPKVSIVCRECGSKDVLRDAWSEFDEEAQDWVLQNVFDNAYCNKCSCETSLDEVPYFETPEEGDATQAET